jgi:hypothetical protein
MTAVPRSTPSLCKISCAPRPVWTVIGARRSAGGPASRPDVAPKPDGGRGHASSLGEREVFRERAVNFLRSRVRDPPTGAKLGGTGAPIPASSIVDQRAERLTPVGRECRDVEKICDIVVAAGLRDDSSPRTRGPTRTAGPSSRSRTLSSQPRRLRRTPWGLHDVDAEAIRAGARFLLPDECRVCAGTKGMCAPGDDVPGDCAQTGRRAATHWRAARRLGVVRLVGQDAVAVTGGAGQYQSSY